MDGIYFEVDGEGIGVLTVKRPQVRNALGWAAMAAFAEAVEDAHQMEELRALIVTGHGQAFISGGDLSELQHYPQRKDGLRLATVMGEALKRLETLPCPTIAAINGPARGGGAEVAVACDLRVMDETADIGFVHARLGIVTGWGGGQRLLGLVGYSRALDLIASGRVLSAQQAYALGLADAISVKGEALTEATELAGTFGRNPIQAVRAAKRLLRAGLMMPRVDALQAEREEFPLLWDTDYRRGVVERFLNKKAPESGNGRVSSKS